jgi:hypothetical protein
MGKLDFRLYKQTAGYKKRDRPQPKKPKVLQPALLKIQEQAGNDLREAALANLIWLAFFFLLRPGEYVWTNSNPPSFHS